MPGIERAYVLYDVDNKPGFIQGQADHGHGLRQAGRLGPTRRGAGLGHPLSGGRGHRRPETRKRHRLRSQRPHVARQLRRERRRGRKPLPLAETNLRAGLEGQNSQRPVLHPQRHRGAERGARSRAIARTKQDERSSAGERQRRDHRAADPAAAVAQQPNTATILNNLLGGSRSDDEKAEPEAAEAMSRGAGGKGERRLHADRARVSVGVPISYFKKVWQERNAGRARPASENARPGRAGSDSQRGIGQDSDDTWPNCCRRPRARPRRPNWSP